MPITEIKVDSIQNIKQLIIETQKDDTIGRYRSPALFRGLPNSTYTLQTSLYRNCKEKSIELETSILRNFYKYALPIRWATAFSLSGRSAMRSRYNSKESKPEACSFSSAYSDKAASNSPAYFFSCASSRLR